MGRDFPFFFPPPGLSSFFSTVVVVSLKSYLNALPFSRTRFCLEFPMPVSPQGTVSSQSTSNSGLLGRNGVTLFHFLAGRNHALFLLPCLPTIPFSPGLSLFFLLPPSVDPTGLPAFSSETTFPLNFFFPVPCSSPQFASSPTRPHPFHNGGCSHCFFHDFSLSLFFFPTSSFFRSPF